ARFIKPMDEETILSEGKKYRNIVTLEEGVLTGGFGEEVNSLFKDIDGVRVKNIALPDEFIEHGSVEELRDKYGLGTEEIISTIVEFVNI
nr:1-deoxy-D-xylulose-5-phosphate synthase [Lachnospiraceae bacterium]